jgi:hypothetical protein
MLREAKSYEAKTYLSSQVVLAKDLMPFDDRTNLAGARLRGRR